MKQHMYNMWTVLQHACMLVGRRWKSLLGFLGAALGCFAALCTGIAVLSYILCPSCVEALQTIWGSGLQAVDMQHAYLYLAVLLAAAMMCLLMFMSIYIRLLSNIVQDRAALTWNDVGESIKKVPQFFLALLTLTFLLLFAMVPLVFVLLSDSVLFVSGDASLSSVLATVATATVMLFMWASFVLHQWLIMQENYSVIQAFGESNRRMRGYRLQWLVLLLIPMGIRRFVDIACPWVSVVVVVRLLHYLYGSIVLQVCTAIYYYITRSDASVPGLQNDEAV